MDQQGDEVHTSETEASGGSKEGVVRWVLIIGTLLAIGFLTIIWVTGAATQDPEDSYVSVSTEQQQTTDGDRGEPIAPAMTGEVEATDAADMEDQLGSQ